MYKNLRGLKFPDNAVIKFFFKNGLHEKRDLKVVEFACSNGNNLSLFASYDHDCIGIDISPKNIEDANYNFKNVLDAKKFKFYSMNMLDFPAKNSNLNADIFLLPNVVNYLPREDFIRFLRLCKEHKIYKQNAIFFIRTRSVKDHRYGLGKKIARNCFKIDDNDNSTSEAGCVNTLYQDFELVEILKQELNLRAFKVLNYDTTTPMGELLINDSDIVIYGNIS